MYEYLVEKIDQFYKKAALLKVPAKLEKQISDWAVGIYCGALLPIISDGVKDLASKGQRPSRNLIFARSECIKHYKPEYANPQHFNVDLKDLNYFNDKDLAQLGTKYSPTVSAEFIFNAERAKEIYGEHNWTGLWTGSLYIHVPPPVSYESITEERVKNIATEIRQTVRHEAQHMVQSYVTGLKDLKDTAGLPSKKIMDNDIDYGSLEGYYKEDREFYNLLTDSIERFKMVVNKFPMNLHRMLMDVWIGRASYQELERRFIGEFNRAHNRQSEDDSTEGKLRVMMPQVSNSILIGSNLFHHLKNGSPKKYEKAVSEFFKAVQGSL